MKLQERDKDIDELKVTVEFLKNKINAAIIIDPSSELISNDKSIPKVIKFSAISCTAKEEISK